MLSISFLAAENNKKKIFYFKIFSPSIKEEKTKESWSSSSMSKASQIVSAKKTSKFHKNTKTYLEIPLNFKMRLFPR